MWDVAAVLARSARKSQPSPRAAAGQRGLRSSGNKTPRDEDLGSLGWRPSGTRGARGHTWQGQGWGRSKRGHKNQGEDAAKGLRAWRRGRSDREAELVAGFKRKIWGGERGEESGFKETFWKQPRSLYNQQYRSREHRGCFFRRIQSSAVLKQLGGTVAAGLGPRRPSPDFRMGSVLQDVLPRQLLAPAGWWHASCPSFVPRCHSSWDPTGARCPRVRGPELLLARCQQTPWPWGKQGMEQQGPSLPRCDSRVPSSPSPLNRGLGMLWGGEGKG